MKDNDKDFIIDSGMFEVVGSSLEETVEFYNKWNEEVKRTVPADRLLVHTLTIQLIINQLKIRTQLMA